MRWERVMQHGRVGAFEMVREGDERVCASGTPYIGSTNQLPVPGLEVSNDFSPAKPDHGVGP